MSFLVPTVDISSYVVGGSADERKATAEALAAACREVGFVQITGHGIPLPVIDGLKAAMDSFFAQTLEEKKQFVTPPGINRGYAPPKSEAISLSLGVAPANKMNDFFEAFNVGLDSSTYPEPALADVEYQENVWTDDPQFREGVWTYLLEARRVAETLTLVAADALGLSPERVADLMGQATGTMRMNNYSLPPATIDLDGDLTGMGEHTDYGVITVLWADQVKGLQVLGSDGSWNDVSPADDALLVNLGDVMARWTNEKWMSTLHRVKPPIVDGMIERRRSAAYFHSGNPLASTAALTELLAEGEQPLYEPVTLAEHSKAKLAGSRAGVSNAGAPREAARVISAQS